MIVIITVILHLLTNICYADPADFPLSCAGITAPVVHEGGRYILSCGETYVVLDDTRGLSIGLAGRCPLSERGPVPGRAAVSGASLRVTLNGDSGPVVTDQANDPSPRLMIIDQGPSRTAARVYFTLRSDNGDAYGSGSLDLYIYEGKVFLLPSLFIDYREGIDSVSRAGLDFTFPGRNVELISGGTKLLPSGEDRFIPYGGDDEEFDINVDNPGRPSLKIGWLRNRYPSWMYMRQTSENPETDELYEKWPHWITQRGNPLAWNLSPHSGLTASYDNNSLRSLSFQWAREDSLEIPAGGYAALNGVMAIFLGDDSAELRSDWQYYRKPIKPTITSGVYKYYNEFEGVHEIDSQSGDVGMVFDNYSGKAPCPVVFRIWNLEGKGGWEAKADNKTIPLGLYNDGDYIDDPMVSVVREISGPARYAMAAFTATAGTKTRVSLSRSPGIQLTYQMYSDLHTMEAWCDQCAENPLFRFHITKGEIYRATLPGYHDYAFFKLPVYWLKNGVNQNTFMNRTRGFSVGRNGPDMLRFTYTGTDLAGTGRSVYEVTVPYERDSITFDVSAKFEALDDGVRWTSLEYCDLYPFEDVYRKDFHYSDVVFLTSSGVFDKVGTGAWNGGFETTVFPDSMGYHAKPVSREGPGTKIPSPDDGTVWLLGDNTERGNIIYHRGEWSPSPGSQSVFSLCNAWVDIHNTIVGRSSASPRELIEYSVGVFKGAVPSVPELTALYSKAAGDSVVRRIEEVDFSLDGEIVGFEVAR